MPLNTATTVSSAGQGSDVELDLRAIGAAIRANLVWIVAVTLAAFLGAAVFVNVVTPRYSAEARIVIENQQTSLTRHAGPAGQGAETAPPIDQEAVQSQVQIIQSRDIARAVIRDLDLTKVAEFDPMVDGRSPFTVVLALLGIVRDVSQMTAEERALEAYYQRLSAYPVDRSRVIEIRFQSKDPERAAQIANAIAERFIATQAGARLERDRRARQHVLRTIEDLRQAVSTAENKVQEYRSRFDLLTGTSNQTLGIQTVSELNTQLSAAQTQRADAQARATSIRAMLRANRPIESSEVLGSPVIQRLTEQRAALKAEIAQQATVLLPGHPRMRELNAQLSDNDAQIRAQAERIARGLENDAQIAGEREAQLRRAFEEQKRRTAAQGDQEVTLRALEREAKAQRDLLESWLGLYRESAARDSPDARTAEARIVSLATPSNTPAWPNKLPTVLIVTLAALSLMLVLTVTRELISGRAFTSDRGAMEPMERADPWLPAPAERVSEAPDPAAD